MNILKIFGLIVLAVVVLPFVLKLAFGLIGVSIALTVLAIKLAIYGGIAWLLYKGFKLMTA